MNPAFSEQNQAFQQTYGEQFHAVIESIQALQHKRDARYMQSEIAQSLSDMLAVCLPDSDAGCVQMVAASRVYVGVAGPVVGKGAAQLYAGIGMTSEAVIGHDYKSLKMIAPLFASREDHGRCYDGVQEVA